MKRRKLVLSDQITTSPKHHSPSTRPRALRQRSSHQLSSPPHQLPGQWLSPRRCTEIRRRTEIQGRAGSTASLPSSVRKMYHPPNTVNISSIGHLLPLKTDGEKHLPVLFKQQSKPSMSSSTLTPATSSSSLQHPPSPEIGPELGNVKILHNIKQVLPKFAASQEDRLSGRLKINCQEATGRQKLMSGTKPRKKEDYLPAFKPFVSTVQQESIPAVLTTASCSSEAGSLESSASSSSWSPAGAEHYPGGRIIRGQGGRSPNNIGSGANIEDILSLHETLCQTTAAYSCTRDGAPNLNTGGGMTTALTARSVPTNGNTGFQQEMHHWTTPLNQMLQFPREDAKPTATLRKSSCPD